MTVYFDKGRQRWKYDFWRDDARYVAQATEEDGTPCRNRTRALRSEERAKGRVSKKAKAPPPPRGVPVLGHAFAAYLPTLAPEGDQFGDDRRAQLAELGRQLGWATPIAEVEAKLHPSASDEGYIAWSRKQPVMVYVGGPRKRDAQKNPDRPLWRAARPKRLRTDATINRYLDCLRRAIGHYGAGRDPANGEPRLAWLPAIPRLGETQRLPRPIGESAIARIREEAAPWVADAVGLIRHMGFRKAEMLAIRIKRQVDIEARGIWLRGEDTKADRDEFVEANPEAMKIIRRRVAEARLLGIDFLFWYTPPARKAVKGKPQPKPPRPQPIKDFKGAWKRAVKRAGLDPGIHRIHDLKASFVTQVARVARASTVQSLARHKSFSTTQRYLKVADADRRAAVDAIAKPPGLSPTRQSHPKRRA